MTLSLDGLLAGYRAGPFRCELLDVADPAAHAVARRFDGFPLEMLQARSEDASRELYNLGITFTVYSDRDAIDRILPFDVIPRIITSSDWAKIETGVTQRVAALNAFLADIYGQRRVIKEKLIPEELVLGNPQYRPEMIGFTPPGGVYVHIAGIDLVRDEQGHFRVLEDNARTPSGVSYVIENRHLMQRLFPDIMLEIGVLAVSDYGAMLHQKLCQLSPVPVDEPVVVLLSPGVFNLSLFRACLPGARDGCALGGRG